MNKIESGEKLDFNHVLIRPKRSTINSRSEVSLERPFTFKYSPKTWNGVPIIASLLESLLPSVLIHDMSKSNKTK